MFGLLPFASFFGFTKTKDKLRMFIAVNVAGDWSCFSSAWERINTIIAVSHCVWDVNMFRFKL